MGIHATKINDFKASLRLDHDEAATPVRKTEKLDISKISPEFQAKTVAVISDKSIVALALHARTQLLELASKDCSPYKIALLLNRMGVIGHIDFKAHHVKRVFSTEGHALLVRTLTKGESHAQGLSEKDSSEREEPPASYSPMRVERNVMNNRLRELSILLTPSTLIAKDVNVSTISNHPDRPKWSNMPSVIYTTPLTQGTHSLGRVDSFKKSFGNTLSFASNNGFTSEFINEVKSGDYSHAQLLDAFRDQPVIKKNLKAPAPFDELPQSLSKLKQQIHSFQQLQKEIDDNSTQSMLYQDRSLPHNEVINRLYLWDASAVEVGKDMMQGLSCAIELQMARKSLDMEFELLGISHPLFNEFLLQQVSVGPLNTSLNKYDTMANYNNLTPIDKMEILEKLKEKLQAPISICKYSPCSSQLRGFEETEITSTDILNAFDGILETRLGPTGFNAIVDSLS